MKLVSFSVENYRSITTARKIPLSEYYLLIGANNEGKSNILHALTLAMSALVSWHRSTARLINGKMVRLTPSALGHEYSVSYDWNTDYPVAKQKKARAAGGSNSLIVLEFSLTEEEVTEFKTEIKSKLNGNLPISIAFCYDSIDLTVQKPGTGFKTLNKNSAKIADFVSKRIRFEYIPAIRTASGLTGTDESR